MDDDKFREQVLRLCTAINDPEVLTDTIVSMATAWADSRAAEKQRERWRLEKQAYRSADFQRQGIYKNNNNNTNTTIPMSSEVRGHRYRQAFLEFWQCYPRKVQKGAAQKAWLKAARLVGGEQELLEMCKRSLAWQTRQRDWQRDGGKFIPYPATWLNGGGYDDDPPGSGAGSVRQRPRVKVDDPTAHVPEHPPARPGGAQ